jgi:hypothetical protein
LQKKAVQNIDDKSCWPRIGDIILSPQWISGFILSIIVPLPGSILAYALAPMSLLAPLSGFTILVNYVMAPPFLGEKLQPIPDTAASICILTGCVLTTIFGDHGGDKAEEMDVAFVMSLITEEVFLVALACLVTVLAPSMTYMYIRREAIEAAARAQPSKPPMPQLLLPAMLYAGFGCITNVGLKAVSELLGAGKPVFLCAAVFVVVVVPPASLQLNFLNRGLRLYLQVIFFPVSSALLLIANTLYGALFYKEYVKFADAPVDLVYFASGVTLIVVGINVFRFRKQAQPDSKTLDGTVSTDVSTPHDTAKVRAPQVDAAGKQGRVLTDKNLPTASVAPPNPVVKDAELHIEPSGDVAELAKVDDIQLAVDLEGELGVEARQLETPWTRQSVFKAMCPFGELLAGRACRP